MNLFSRVLNWHRSNSKKATVSYFTLAGTYVAYRIVVDEIENRKVNIIKHPFTRHRGGKMVSLRTDTD